MEDIISMQIQNASPFPFPHVSTCFHTTSQTGEASTESRREAPSRARREGPAARGAHGSRSAHGSRGACHGGSATGGDAWQMMGFGRLMHLTVLDQQKGHQRWGFHHGLIFFDQLGIPADTTNYN